jgi:hypothetical protein
LKRQSSFLFIQLLSTLIHGNPSTYMTVVFPKVLSLLWCHGFYFPLKIKRHSMLTPYSLPIYETSSFASDNRFFFHFLLQKDSLIKGITWNCFNTKISVSWNHISQWIIRLYILSTCSSVSTCSVRV